MAAVLQFCPFYKKHCPSAQSSVGNPSDLFFAYASDPTWRVDAIRGAISRIRSDQKLCIQVTDWAELPIEGAPVFCAICEAIRNTRCLVADISGLNFNVLFEFGFAIGCGKPVWPIVDRTSEQSHIYSRFQTLTAVGHSTYLNSKTIAEKIEKKKPWMRQPHLFAPSSTEGKPTRNARGILYMKSPYEDEASLRITETFGQAAVEIITDDPAEIPFQPLSWYLQRFESTYAVLVDLGHEAGEASWMHMAKCALVAGLAVATGRRLLMLGDKMVQRPIDYGDLLRTYKNAAEAASIAKQFGQSVTLQIRAFQEELRSTITRAPLLEIPAIRNINLGEYVAENELPYLSDYFVEITQFQEALKGGFRIVTGRKGSGKTALAHMVAANVRNDSRNLVTLVYPKGYELNQVVDMVRHFPQPTRAKFLESLWKYMLTTEVLSTIAESVGAKTLESSWSAAESNVQRYLENAPDLKELSFPSRLISLLEKQRLLPSGSSLVPETAILARLNQTELRMLRDLICKYLVSQKRRLTLLVDGLVPNWGEVEQRDLIAQVLLALLQAVRELWQDWDQRLERDGALRACSVVVFVRTDIFRILLAKAQEPDKTRYEELFWNDAESLLQVISRRIENSILKDKQGSLNWRDMLEPGFSYDQLLNRIESCVLYRPRDVIYYFQRVLFHANRRDSNYLTRRDFDDAFREYSEYVVQALSAEWHVCVPDMTNLLLGFWGKRADFSYDELGQVLLASQVKEQHVEEVIRFLIEAQFLGLATDEHNYRFALTPIQAETMTRQVGRFLHEYGGGRRFKIHRAFHDCLGLTEVSRRGNPLHSKLPT